MEKILSIIIPIYNGEKYINKLIESIEKYNYDIATQIEILLIDDGSKDNSLAVCQNISNKYSNVVLFTKINEGIALTREYGVRHALGKYITFCDQDDEVVSGYDKFIKNVEDNDCEMLISNYVFSSIDEEKVNDFIHNDSVYERQNINEILKNFVSPILMEQSVFKDKRLPSIAYSIWNCIFSRKFIIDKDIHFIKFVDFDDDWVFLVSTLSLINKLYCTKDLYYCWKINPLSESNTYKFIPNFFNKRGDLLNWTLQKLSILRIDTEILKLFILTFNSQTILKGFYMLCGLKYSQYKRGVTDVVRFGNLKQYRNTAFLGGKRKYLRWLLNHKLYMVAYYLNNYI